MAQRRMFSMSIMDSDAFLDMPTTSQLLYVHLGMRADDEGFIGNPKRIVKMTGANEDDLKILLAKKFLLAFESGVVVIKHWRMHNTIRMDRFTQTTYKREKDLLFMKENRGYSLTKEGNISLATRRQPNGNLLATQVKLSKDNINTSSKSEIPNPRVEEIKVGIREMLKSTRKQDREITATNTSARTGKRNG